MIKVMALLTRKPGLTLEQFDSHWHKPHGIPLTLNIEGIRHSVQNARLADADDLADAPFDGIPEVWLDDLAAAAAMQEAPGYKEADEDQQHFMDIPKLQFLLTEEDPVDGEPGPGDADGVNVIRLLRRADGVEPEQFAQRLGRRRARQGRRRDPPHPLAQRPGELRERRARVRRRPRAVVRGPRRRPRGQRDRGLERTDEPRRCRSRALRHLHRHPEEAAMSTRTIDRRRGQRGGALAARLTEDPDQEVILVEAGPDYPDLDEVPADVRDAYEMSVVSHDWGLQAYFVEPPRRASRSRIRAGGWSAAPPA